MALLKSDRSKQCAKINAHELAQDRDFMAFGRELRQNQRIGDV